MTQDSEFRDGMPFFGGSLWLDLVNTVPAEDGVPRDLIAAREGVRAWLDAAGLNMADADKGPALRALRETLRLAFEALAQGRAPSKAALAAINEKLGALALRYELAIVDGAPKLRETLDAGKSGAAGEVALDFARFADAYEPERLRHCANPACTMVFYDRGKNNTRRWCSMSLCGNRDKVARYRARQAKRDDAS